MKEILDGLAAGVCANMYLGTEIAFRLVDVLVAKKVMTKREARAILYGIAEGIRKDADEDPTVCGAVEALASTLEKSADIYSR